MAVQKSKKTRSKRGMIRSHDHLKDLTLSTDPVSGERHLRHQMTADGFYKGRLIKDLRKPVKEEERIIQHKTKNVFFSFLAFPGQGSQHLSMFSKGDISDIALSSEYSHALECCSDLIAHDVFKLVEEGLKS